MAASSPVKFEMEVELKSPADAFWNTIKDINFIYPKLLPEIFESIEILEGDGRSAGTLRLVTYTHESEFGRIYKSKIESLDEENKTVTYRVLDGCLLKCYKFLDDTIVVRGKDKGCVVIWICIYEKAIKEAPDGEMMRDNLVGIFHKLDAYTLNKNEI